MFTRKMKRKSNKAKNLIDFSENDQINMWKFILRNFVENKKFQRVDESLWEEYVKTNHLDHSSSDIEHFYNSNMVKSLYKSDLSANEILLLYQHLEIPISKHVEEMLEEDCKVLLRLNAQKILVNYRFINSNRRDSSEIRKTTNSISEPMVKKRRTDDSNEGAVLPDDLFVSDNLEKKMMEFVKKNMHRVNEFLTPNFWKEFSKSEGLEFSSPYLLARVFHTWLPDLFKSKMEIANKLKIMQEFMVLVTPEQKYWLLRHNNVEVFINSNGHVEKWELLNNECEIRNKRVSDVMKSNKKRIHLKKSKSEIASWNQKETVEELESPRNKNTLPPQCSTSHSAPNRQRRNLSPDADDSDSENYKPIPREIKCKLKYSEEEDLEIWKFVLEKMLNENMDGPSGEIVKPKGFTLWRTYVKEKKSSRTSETLASHFRKAMIPKLHLANLKAEEIFWLFHLLEIPIENSQKNYLEAKFNAQLEISDKILKKWKIVKKEIVEIGKNNGLLESDKNEEDVTIEEEEEEEAVTNENEENVTIEDEEKNVNVEDAEENVTNENEENVNVEDGEEAETIEEREDVDAIEQRADAMEEEEKTENTEKGEAEANKELEERSEYETIEKTAEAIEEREVAEDNERKTDAIEGGKEAETIEEEEAVTNENEENVTTEDEDKNLNVEDGEENLNVEDGEEAENIEEEEENINVKNGEEAENIKEGAKATEEGHLENKSEVVEGGEAVEQNYDLFAHSMETVLDSNLSMKNEILENILDESKKTNNISDLVDSVKNVVRHENLTALTIEQLKKEMEEILENRLDEMPSIKKEKIEHLIDILVKEFLNKSQNPNVFKIFLENIKERLIECIENI